MAMSKRETATLTDLFTRLRPYANRPAIDTLERRLRALISADEQKNRLDGYPTQTPGSNSGPGGGSGGRASIMIPDDETGEPDWVPTSSTETSTLRRPADDPVHKLRRRADRATRHAVEALETLRNTLDAFDQLRNTNDVGDPPYCYVAQHILGLPYDVLWEPFRQTDFATILPNPFDEPRHVSASIYWFVRNHRRLPTPVEAKAMLERGVARIHENTGSGR